MFSDDWNELNNTWIAHFINEGKIIPGFKDKVHSVFFILQREDIFGNQSKALRFRCLNFVVLFGEGWKLDLTSLVANRRPKALSSEKENQVSSHQEEYEKEKENQVTAIASHSKRIIKIPVKDKNIKLINFCYNILQELDKKSNTHPFYKYDEKEISNKIIKNPMDLFTIILKLEHDQYTNTEEFEKDIHPIFCNCYIYNDVGSEMHTLGEALELLIRFGLKKLFLKQVVNDATLIVSAYENLVSGNIIPFIEILKTFLLTRSQMYLFSADEPVLQAIVESLLPLKYCIPELSLVMDGTKPKGFGRFGYSDIFILKGIGNNNVSLELKYISLVGLIKNQKKKFNTNDLENLDKIIEKEDEKVLLKRLYTYWSKEHNETRQTTIEDILNNGVNQLKSYMNIISKGKTIDYYSSGIFDKRIKITKSNSNKLEGFVILVIGFRHILWRSVEEIITNYSYDKI
ncbi:hypothetical protein GLOIN_2v1781474 [Rhizophagus irregularis DAOM 181602=DAOM 197198]|nr:hypothetical protein GLOIN_2v1781474 [Rhizophagus irregularis DAOM 181602=DAOM 197198]